LSKTKCQQLDKNLCFHIFQDRCEGPNMMSTRSQHEVTSTLCIQLITKYNSTIPSVPSTIVWVKFWCVMKCKPQTTNDNEGKLILSFLADLIIFFFFHYLYPLCFFSQDTITHLGSFLLQLICLVTITPTLLSHCILNKWSNTINFNEFHLLYNFDYFIFP
jgi:hypothetical protein